MNILVVAVALRLLDPSSSPDAEFGSAVAVSGSLAFVGSPGDDTAGKDAGAVHVYDGGVLVESLHGAVEGGRFGASLAVDGRYLVVGAPNADGAGEVRIYEDLREIAVLRPEKPSPGMRFGDGVAIESGTVVVGAPLESTAAGVTGVGYVFARSSRGKFTLLQRLVAVGIPNGGGLGSTAAIRSDLIALGAPYLAAEFLPGQVRTFHRTANGWVRGEEIRSPFSTPRDRFGRGLALVNGELLVGAPRDLVLSQGLLCTFRPRTDPGGVAVWDSIDVQLSPDSTRFDRFGADLATDGTRLVVGAPSAEPSGRAWAYRLEQGRWVPYQELVAPVTEGFTLYGARVAVSGRTAVVGAPLDDGEGEDAGAAFLFDLGE